VFSLLSEKIKPIFILICEIRILLHIQALDFVSFCYSSIQAYRGCYFGVNKITTYILALSDLRMRQLKILPGNIYPVKWSVVEMIQYFDIRYASYDLYIDQLSIIFIDFCLSV